MNFGRLIVVRFHESRKGRAFWICLCACGKEASIPTIHLANGHTKSCGCYKRDLSRESHFRVASGQVFSRLTVIGYDKEKRKWRCRCSCGQEAFIVGASLLQEATRSCGCLKKEIVAALNLSHGFTHTSEYSAWCKIKGRCFNDNDSSYERYGARGITMCERYMKSFESFLADVGPKPDIRLSLDRHQNHLGYTCGKCNQCEENGWPFNLRWATASQQILNSSRAHWVTFRGQTLPLSTWADKLGINAGTLSHRLKKHPPEIALTMTKRNYASSILFKQTTEKSSQPEVLHSDKEQEGCAPPAGFLF